MGDKINIRTVYDGKEEAESISDEIVIKEIKIASIM